MRRAAGVDHEALVEDVFERKVVEALGQRVVAVDRELALIVDVEADAPVARAAHHVVGALLDNGVDDGVGRDVELERCRDARQQFGIVDLQLGVDRFFDELDVAVLRQVGRLERRHRKERVLARAGSDADVDVGRGARHAQAAVGIDRAVVGGVVQPRGVEHQHVATVETQIEHQPHEHVVGDVAAEDAVVPHGVFEAQVAHDDVGGRDDDGVAARDGVGHVDLAHIERGAVDAEVGVEPDVGRTAAEPRAARGGAPHVLHGVRQVEVEEAHREAVDVEAHVHEVGLAAVVPRAAHRGAPRAVGDGGVELHAAHLGLPRREQRQRAERVAVDHQIRDVRLAVYYRIAVDVAEGQYQIHAAGKAEAAVGVGLDDFFEHQIAQAYADALVGVGLRHGAVGLHDVRAARYAQPVDVEAVGRDGGRAGRDAPCAVAEGHERFGHVDVGLHLPVVPAEGRRQLQRARAAGAAPVVPDHRGAQGVVGKRLADAEILDIVEQRQRKAVGPERHQQLAPGMCRRLEAEALGRHAVAGDAVDRRAQPRRAPAVVDESRQAAGVGIDGGRVEHPHQIVGAIKGEVEDGVGGADGARQTQLMRKERGCGLLHLLHERHDDAREREVALDAAFDIFGTDRRHLAQRVRERHQHLRALRAHGAAVGPQHKVGQGHAAHGVVGRTAVEIGRQRHAERGLAQRRRQPQRVEVDVVECGAERAVGHGAGGVYLAVEGQPQVGVVDAERAVEMPVAEVAVDRYVAAVVAVDAEAPDVAPDKDRRVAAGGGVHRQVDVAADDAQHAAAQGAPEVEALRGHTSANAHSARHHAHR